MPKFELLLKPSVEKTYASYPPPLYATSSLL